MKASGGTLLLLVLIAAGYLFVPEDKGELTIKDVTKKAEFVVKKPWAARGRLSVTVTGALVGQGRVFIHYDEGRTRSMLELKAGGQRGLHLSEAEVASAVRVTYEPLDASAGELKIVVRRVRDTRR